jgi:hypothetical protein
MTTIEIIEAGLPALDAVRALDMDAVRAEISRANQAAEVVR